MVLLTFLFFLKKTGEELRMKVRFLFIVFIAFLVGACTPKQNQNERLPLHFHAGSGWVGEPSGLVFFNGKYHMFFQTNPDQPFAGNFHLGHTVSNDLIRWELLPVALSPDSLGEINPGSVVIDVNNTSGLGEKDSPPFIAFYTVSNEKRAMMESESEHRIEMAYSLDEGLSWTKCKEPVLKTSNFSVFRNPGVKWDESQNRWLMTVSVGSAVQFYDSDDCLHWNLLSAFGDQIETSGGWESSDFFSLDIENQTKSILMVGMNNGPSHGAPAIRYFIGDFDGTKFSVTQHQELWVDYGKDHYEGLTFNNLPDQRKIMISWMNCWEYANQTPEEKSRGAMVFPRELKLISEGDHYILGSLPVQEINRLAEEPITLREMEIEGEKPIFTDRHYLDDPLILQLKFDNSNRFAIWGPRAYGVHLKTRSGKRLSVGYNAEMRYFYIDRTGLATKPFSSSYEQITGAGFTITEPASEWYILVDKGAVELFACKGKVAITSLYYSDEKFEAIEVFSDAGTSVLLEASLSGINIPIN